MIGWKQSRGLVRLGFAVALLMTGGVSGLAAQEVETERPQPELTERQQQQLEELERRFIERVSEALDLSEEQARRLTETLRASRQERMDLVRRRAALRRELNRSIAEASPDEVRIQQLLDQRAALERRQIEVGRDEERRLGEFMSPVQKARFMYLRQRMAQALRDRVRRADAQRPQQRPRRPTGVDRPRTTDQAPVRGPQVDSRPAAPERRAAGAARVAP